MRVQKTQRITDSICSLYLILWACKIFFAPQSQQLALLGVPQNIFTVKGQQKAYSGISCVGKQYQTKHSPTDGWKVTFVFTGVPKVIQTYFGVYKHTC